jgi:hypothetical protein
MVSQPRFANHDEQQAMLGCAAHLDPDKHPRRYALHKARTRMHGQDIAIVEETDGPRTILDSRREHAARQDADRRALADRAKLYRSLTMKEAAVALGISYEKCKKLRAEFDLQFKPGYRNNSSKPA